MSAFDRRRLLFMGGGLAGALIAAAALKGRALAQEHVDDPGAEVDVDVDDNDEPGYDLNARETHAIGTRRLAVGQLPPRFLVDPTFLPPVGNQGKVGACVSWAAGYGLTTYMLARRDKRDAGKRENQVSAAYLYGTVLNAKASGCDSAKDLLDRHCDSKPSDHLVGGPTNLSMTLAVLRLRGSVTAAQCPYPKVSVLRRVATNALYENIYAAWGRTQAPPSFKIGESYGHPIRIDELKAVLAQGEPLAFGTRLPKRFKPKDGPPWEDHRTLRKGGHAMLLIGYDDEMASASGQRGAFLVQNSWGKGWGMSWPADAFKSQYPDAPGRSGKGYVWITYEAFRALARAAFSIAVPPAVTP